MQIRAIDTDIITIETKPGEIISIKPDGDGLLIKTRNSSFLIQGGYLVKHIEDNQIKLKKE